LCIKQFRLLPRRQRVLWCPGFLGLFLLGYVTGRHGQWKTKFKLSFALLFFIVQRLLVLNFNGNRFSGTDIGDGIGKYVGTFLIN
jgi:hypothetical protein